MNHGWGGYTNHGCKCRICLDANNLYQQQYRTGRRRIDLVCASEAREHVLLLEERGLHRAQIARFSGMSPAGLSRLARGISDRIERRHADRLLAIGLTVPGDKAG